MCFKKIILFVLLCIHVAGFAQSDQDAVDMFPLVVGNTWYFKYGYPDDGGGICEIKSVEDTISINNQKYFVWRSTWGEGRFYDQFIRKDSLGNVLVLSQKDSSEHMWFKFDLEPDSQYLFYSPEKFKPTVTIKRDVTKKTPAAIFDNCTRFRFDHPDVNDEERWYTFAPNVGLVRYQQASISWELDHAIVNGRLIKNHSHYFPLQIGNSWTYHEYLWPDYKHTESITDTTRIDGKLYYNYCSSLFRQDNLGRIYKYEPDGEWLYLDFTLMDGEHYYHRKDVLNYQVSVYRGLERETEIGSLSDCIYIAYDDTLAVDEEFSFTFAPNIGQISRFLGGGIYYVIESAIIDGQLITFVENRYKSLPTQIYVDQNYPNPFNPTTTIKYELPTPGHISIKIFDLTGRLVKILAGQQQNAGAFSAQWDGTDLVGKSVAAGIYFYRVEFVNSEGERFVESRKMSLVK